MEITLEIQAATTQKITFYFFRALKMDSPDDDIIDSNAGIVLLQNEAPQLLPQEENLVNYIPYSIKPPLINSLPVVLKPNITEIRKKEIITEWRTITFNLSSAFHGYMEALDQLNALVEKTVVPGRN
jgi:hypothetical protein